MTTCSANSIIRRIVGLGVLGLAFATLVPAASASSPARHSRPKVRITTRHLSDAGSRAAIDFKSNVRHIRFRCAIDRRRYARCSSPTHYGRLSAGTHTFRVLAGTGHKTAAARASWVTGKPVSAVPAVSAVSAVSAVKASASSSAWRPYNHTSFKPLSDSAAAALVAPAPENRPANTAANDDMPTASQLQTFRGAVDNWGDSILVADPYYKYVTGHYTGTTDEIIQWAAEKWGIPADVLRAQYVQESNWKMSQLGDLATVTPAQYLRYPPQARVPGTDEVYESMGISQVKWTPDGSSGAGTEPMRWESTAFNVDYQAATVRFYFDDPSNARSAWGDSTYSPGQDWNSIGGWYEPYPWLNSGQMNYIQDVQAQLAAHPWTQSNF